MRTALVTGANRGIGLALTKESLHRGYTVHATHRRDIGGLATIDHEHLLTHAMDVRIQTPSMPSSIVSGLVLTF